MSHPVTRAGVAAALSALALGTVAVPAHAAERTIEDGRNDVSHGVDLRSVKLVNEKNVRVVVRHKNLVRSPQSGAGMTVWLDTDRSRRGPEYAFVGGLFEGTDYALLRTNGWDTSQGRRVHAGTYEMKLDYAKDVTRIRISRAALGRPGEVRLSVRAGGQQEDGEQVTDWLRSRRHLTAWVARG